jgi:hypothetical protein
MVGLQGQLITFSLLALVKTMETVSAQLIILLGRFAVQVSRPQYEEERV